MGEHLTQGTSNMLSPKLVLCVCVFFFIGMEAAPRSLNHGKAPTLFSRHFLVETEDGAAEHSGNKDNESKDDENKEDKISGEEKDYQCANEWMCHVYDVLSIERRWG